MWFNILKTILFISQTYFLINTEISTKWHKQTNKVKLLNGMKITHVYNLDLKTKSCISWFPPLAGAYLSMMLAPLQAAVRAIDGGRQPASTKRVAAVASQSRGWGTRTAPLGSTAPKHLSSKRKTAATCSCTWLQEDFYIRNGRLNLRLALALLSCRLNSSTRPLAAMASPSFTNCIQAPKWGLRTSSTYSALRVLRWSRNPMISRRDSSRAEPTSLAPSRVCSCKSKIVLKLTLFLLYSKNSWGFD